ncbi:hypothetical protein MXB_375 [Myxobolus squamalis]|nr:hypothetical protein MXB_375 [Myxobolus squamalis]
MATISIVDEKNYPPVTLKFLSTDKFAKVLIGKKGDNVKRMCQESNCKILITGEYQAIRHLEITGIPSDLAHAIQLVSDCILLNFDTYNNRDSSVPNTQILLLMLIPKIITGGIIGKRGENIKNIRRISGASLKVITNTKYESNIDTLYMDGSPNELKKVVEFVAEIYTQEYNPTCLAQSCRYCSQIYYVNRSIAVQIIGKKGLVINKLRRSCGANLTVAPYDQDCFMVEISGDPSSVELCLKLIDSE